MEYLKREQLEKAGIAVEEALERMMGNEKMLERFLEKFPKDPNYEKLVEALKEGNQEEALQAAHTLKGICGNLSMRGLYEKFDQQVKAMRAGDWPAAKVQMEEITEMYNKVCQTLQKYFHGGG